MIWMPFLVEELKNSITKCSNTFISELNKLLWRYLKVIINDSICLNNFINIANACINLEYWPSHFKMLSSIIIHKTLYNTSKMFQSIIFLNILSKLIEKFISKRLQSQLISINFIHFC